jgi:hypothetical protein
MSNGKSNPSLKRGILKMVGGALIVALSAFGLYSGSKLFVSGVQETRAAITSRWIGDWTFTHRGADGSVLATWIDRNALVDVGEQRLLEIYFRDASEVSTTQYYVSLSDATNPCSVTETDSLATANTGEPSTNGYARQLVERSATGWPTSALDAGDWRVVSSTETFSASGGSWGPVNCAVLQTTIDNTGDHIAFVALSQARTLASGESLDVSLAIKLQ